MGVLEIPYGVESIGESAFSNCRMLEGLVLPESLETIRRGAFNDSFGIGSIVCKGTMPAYIESGAFDGVAKDNFTLEVPESAVQQYQAAGGWCEFKRIAAHHELVCRPSVACALSTQHKQTLVVNAEGEWEVESKPDWCEVTPASGNKKTEVTLTIKSMSKNASDREGKIVFRLKNKDYTHACTVSQYGYEYGEDEWITLQKATKGRNGGINIVLLGDEYIYHNAFIDACGCSCCGHVTEFNSAKSLGWYDNLSLTGKMHNVGWSHLIFDDRYSDIVDIYEGGYMHNRGVFRSEQNSCMNNDIPYYSTISRESIVKRIMRYAGETFSFEEFVRNDKRDAGTATRSMGTSYARTAHTYQHAPKIHKGSPLQMKKVRRHR